MIRHTHDELSESTKAFLNRPIKEDNKEDNVVILRESINSSSDDDDDCEIIDIKSRMPTVH